MTDLPTWLQAGMAVVAFLQFLLLVFIFPLRTSLDKVNAAIDGLRQSDDRMREDFSAWRVEVAKEYIRRDEVASYHREVLSAIQRLESQIGTLQREKADK